MIDAADRYTSVSLAAAVAAAWKVALSMHAEQDQNVIFDLVQVS